MFNVMQDPDKHARENEATAVFIGIAVVVVTLTVLSLVIASY